MRFPFEVGLDTLRLCTAPESCHERHNFRHPHLRQKLREAGFTEQQAEAQAEALKAVVDDNLATKQDLKELEARITHEMKQMESRITIRLGGMIVAAVVVLAVLIRVL